MEKPKIETEQEADGRWIAEYPEYPGIMAYGKTESEAIYNVDIVFFNSLRVQDTQVLSEVIFAELISGLDSLNDRDLANFIELAKEELFAREMAEITKEFKRLSDFKPDTEAQAIVKDKLLFAQNILQEIMNVEK